MKKIIFLLAFGTMFFCSTAQVLKRIDQLPANTVVHDTDLIFIGHPADGRLFKQQASVLTNYIFDSVNSLIVGGTAQRFGLEDTLGISTRLVNMQDQYLTIRRNGNFHLDAGDDTNNVGTHAYFQLVPGTINMYAQSDADNMGVVGMSANQVNAYANRNFTNAWAYSNVFMNAFDTSEGSNYVEIYVENNRYDADDTLHTLQVDFRPSGIYLSNIDQDVSNDNIFANTDTASYFLQTDENGKVRLKQVTAGGGDGGFLSADNGLTASTSTNVQLGGTLIQNTTLNNSQYCLFIDATGAGGNLNINSHYAGLTVRQNSVGWIGVEANATTAPAFQGYGGGSGTAAVVGNNTGGANAYGVDGSGAAGSGVRGITTGAAKYGIVAQQSEVTTNTVKPSILVNVTFGGVGATGLGGSIDWNMATTTTTQGRASGSITNKWTDATDATRTSQVIISGVLSAAAVNILTLNSNGTMQMRPITATAASAITPAEGMIVFVSSTDATFISIGFWGYRNGAWAAF